MKVVHGEFEKLIPSSNTINGLLKSDIHQSINNVIGKSNDDLSVISSEHDNCLDSTTFSPLFSDTDNTYKNIPYYPFIPPDYQKQDSFGININEIIKMYFLRELMGKMKSDEVYSN